MNSIYLYGHDMTNINEAKKWQSALMLWIIHQLSWTYKCLLFIVHNLLKNKKLTV